MEVLMNVRYSARGLKGSGQFPRKWYPPTLLWALGNERYDESDDIQRHMSEALYIIDRFGYVAM